MAYASIFLISMSFYPKRPPKRLLFNLSLKYYLRFCPLILEQYYKYMSKELQKNCENGTMVNKKITTIIKCYFIKETATAGRKGGTNENK